MARDLYFLQMAKRSRLRFEADDQLGGFLSQTDTEFDKPSNDISDGDDIERFNERVKLVTNQSIAIANLCF